MDTLYLMPDGWWETKDNVDGAAAKLGLKWMKSVSAALQFQASPFSSMRVNYLVDATSAAD